MGTKVNLTFSISNFEPISEDSENKLIGGFSTSVSGTGKTLDPNSNNCSGGNCVEGCGSGQNINCNTVQGCGTVIKG